MIEVELKYKLPKGARAQLFACLDTLPAVQRLKESTNIDAYYDTATFDCLQKAVFIRTRNSAQLEIKYHEHADPTHTYSSERAFPLAPEPLQMGEMNSLCSRLLPGWRKASNVQEALAVNGLTKFMCIEKLRTRYLYGDLVLCVDQVAGLGDFFEVEAQYEKDEEISQARTRLQSFVADLAFPDLRPVTVGYVELWLRQHLPGVYLLGRYREESSASQN